jgi:predicted nucleic acid-binding protein
VTTPVVVDASAAAAWLLKSQQTAAAIAFERQAAKFHLLAPPIFRLEVRNIALVAERRGAVVAHALSGDIAAFESRIAFDVAADAAGWMAQLGKASDLARAHGLSIYDATYLELAQRSAASIVSRDADLLAAAAKDGVGVYDLR